MRRFVDFDFHYECKNDKYENVNILLSKMEDDLLQFGYLSLHSTSEIQSLYASMLIGRRHSVFEAPSLTPLRQQSGIVRTNCIDCLDRTNLVQVQRGTHLLCRRDAFS